MNKIILMGRFGKDPIYKAAANENGVSTARGNLAVDDSYSHRKKGEESEPDWIPIVAFGAKADNMAKLCKQGTKILVTGRLKTGRYQSKDTGEWIYTWNVIVDEWEFAESKSSNSKNTNPPENNRYVPPNQESSVNNNYVQQNQQTSANNGYVPQNQNQTEYSDSEEVPEGFLSDIDGGGFFE